MQRITPSIVLTAALAVLFSIDSALANSASPTGGVIAVQVVDRQAVPVDDALVTLVELRRTEFVDEIGRARFDHVPPGFYHLEAVSERFGAVVEEFTLLEGAELSLRLEVARSIHSERIVVTATPGGRGSAELVAPVTVLDEEALRERMQPTLGETLAQEPGVHSTFFGSGASRPIIRGQSGGRVSVLEGGVGVGDASTTSPDHAVSSDPLGAESIEIVRGPAALIYDTSAIGGLVNIIDGRIPDRAPRRPFGGSLDLRVGSAADETTGALALDGGGKRFAWHVDGARRETDDYEFAGPAIATEPDSETGRLANSATESTTLTVGGSVLFERGFVGLAARTFDSQYGIQEIEIEPAGAMPGPEGGEGVTIDLEQTRIDLRGSFAFTDGFVDALDVRVGLTDYEHTEFEDGAPGTMFFNDSTEARVELAHGQQSSRPGVIGLQYRLREALAEGEEAFLPASEIDTLALFAFQEIEAGPLRVELGGRFETTDVGVGLISPEFAARVAANPNCTAPLDVGFDDLSASAGLVWLGEGGYAVGTSLTRAVRSPGAEALYSCGPHLATQSFEVGNTALTEETGLAIDVNLRKRTGRLTGQLSLFLQRYDDYIFETATGRILTEEGEAYDPLAVPVPELLLPEFRFGQADAEFYGAELSTLLDLKSDDVHHLDLELTGDLVRGELRDSGEPLPRIPAARLGVGLRYRGVGWYGSAHVRRTAKQDRLAPSETLTSALVDGLELLGGSTDAYTLVDASVGYRLVRGGRLHDVAIRATNVTDEPARVHTSRLKNVAPLPGADVSVSYRLVF